MKKRDNNVQHKAAIFQCQVITRGIFFPEAITISNARRVVLKGRIRDTGRPEESQSDVNVNVST